MKDLKILLTRSLLQKDMNYIAENLDKRMKGHYSMVCPSEYSEDSILREVSDADVLLGSYITRRIIGQAHQLKLIQIPWTGMDNFDFDAVKECAVPVCNTHSNAEAVAELGFSLTLDLLKKVSYHDRKMRTGNWNRDQRPLTLHAGLLHEQTVCILGYGHIGRKLATYFDAFGCNVDAVSTHRIEPFPYHTSFASSEKHEAFKNASIIISALPLTNATRGFIDDEAISSMRESALLVNLSRAAIMDEEAVFRGLLSGKLGGFASDVWWNAPARGMSDANPSARGFNFYEFENVVFSPHRAGFIDGKLPHLDGAISNIIALYENRSLDCVVDVSKGY